MDETEGLKDLLNRTLTEYEVERQTVKALREQMKTMVTEHQVECATLRAINTELLARLKGRGVSVATARDAYTATNVRLLTMVQQKDAEIAKLREELQMSGELEAFGTNK